MSFDFKLKDITRIILHPKEDTYLLEVLQLSNSKVIKKHLDGVTLFEFRTQPLIIEKGILPE